MTLPWWYGGLVHWSKIFGIQSVIIPYILNLNAMDKFRGRPGAKAPLALTSKIQNGAFENDEQRIRARDQRE